MEDAVKKSPTESETRPQIVITGDEIVETFTSGTFLMPFRMQAGLQRKTHFSTESGFQIFRSLSSSVRKAMYDTVVDDDESGASSVGIERMDALESSGYFLLVDTHFHPNAYRNAARGIMPSLEDLEALRNASEEIRLDHGYTSQPISAVARVQDHDSVELLVFQSRTPERLERSLIEASSDELSHAVTHDEALEVLRSYNYNADIVQYNPDGFSDADKAKLQAFAFIMRPTSSAFIISDIEEFFKT